MYDNLNLAISGFEEKAKKLYCGNSAWIFKSKSVKDQPLLDRLDAIVVNMPYGEKTKFQKRFADIIPGKAQSYDREYDDHFLEACVEILGWGWLKKRYPLYTPCLTMKTPDLLVKDNSNQEIAAMECKKKRHSKEEECWLRQRKLITRTVDAGLTSSNYSENPLLRNLKDILFKAEQQVNQATAADKFVFLDLSLDVPFMFPELQRQLYCSILGLASELCQKGILLISFENYQVDNPITGVDLL